MIPLILISFSIITFVVLALKQALKPGLREIPGPWICKFTDAWRFNESYHSRLFKTVQDLQKKYGNVVRYGPNIVLLSEKGMYEYVFGFKTDFAKADSYSVWAQMKDGKVIPSLANTTDKRLHAELKKPIAGIYSMTNVVTFEPKVTETIYYLFRRIDEEFIRGSNAGKPCDIDNWVQYFAFDVVGQITLSRRLGFLQSGSDPEGLLADVLSELDYRAVAQQMTWIDTLGRKNPIYTYFKKPSSRFVTHAGTVIRDRLTEEKSEKPSNDGTKGDFMERFLEAQRLHPQIVTDGNLAMYVATNFLAGSDTTAVTLRSIIYYTLRTPGVLQKLRRELDEHAVEYPVSWKTSQTLPYLDAIVKEAMRMHPIGAIMFERKIPSTGLTLPSGHKLPAGSTVAMTPWTLNFDESIFGERPREFKPERWLPGDVEGETEEQAMERVNVMKRNDFTFSYGPRVCLGKHIALLEIYKIVPSLFGLFDIKFVHPEREWKVEGQFFARQYDMDVTFAWREGVDRQKYVV